MEMSIFVRVRVRVRVWGECSLDMWEIQRPAILRRLPTCWLDTSQATKARHCTVNQLLTNDYYDTPWELSDKRQSDKLLLCDYRGVFVLLEVFIDRPLTRRILRLTTFYYTKSVHIYIVPLVHWSTSENPQKSEKKSERAPCLVPVNVPLQHVFKTKTPIFCNSDPQEHKLDISRSSEAKNLIFLARNNLILQTVIANGYCKRFL